MKLGKLITVVALIIYVPITLAQVSNVDDIKPLEGVSILKIQPSKEVNLGSTFKDCSDCPAMVMIPAGSFMMGFANGDSIGLLSGKPQHQVNVQSFALGKYEVTQKEWLAVMSTNLSSNKGAKLPVENVSWDDAQEFVKLLSQKTGKTYRLPSEAEWEYAARAGSTSTYPWGDSVSDLNEYAWFSDNSLSTRPVGLKKPNQFGLYDMIGNVWEWTEDCTNLNYIGAPIDGSAWISGNCADRVVRGGSWSNDSQSQRSASRASGNKANRNYGSGFRVARTK